MEEPQYAATTNRLLGRCRRPKVYYFPDLFAGSSHFLCKFSALCLISFPSLLGRKETPPLLVLNGRTQKG